LGCFRLIVHSYVSSPQPMSFQEFFCLFVIRYLNKSRDLVGDRLISYLLEVGQDVIAE